MCVYILFSLLFMLLQRDKLCKYINKIHIKFDKVNFYTVNNISGVQISFCRFLSKIGHLL